MLLAPEKICTVAGSSTLTTMSSEPTAPSLSVTVTRAVYRPGAGYRWLAVIGFAWIFVLPASVTPSPHALAQDHGLAVCPGSLHVTPTSTAVPPPTHCSGP